MLLPTVSPRAIGARSSTDSGMRMRSLSDRLCRATRAAPGPFPRPRRRTSTSHVLATFCNRAITVRPVSEQLITTLAGPPLPVEFRSGGSWHTGVLLAWRHQPDGICWIRVGFVVGGRRRTSWFPLADVRLPQPAAEASSSPRPAAGPCTRPDALLLDRHLSRPPAPPVPQPGRRPDRALDPGAFPGLRRVSP